MAESMSKHVQIGEWIFEVKMVRALKVSEYGKPYSAIANCNINGDVMYIDGLLTKNSQIFTKSDLNSFNAFCNQMGLKQCSYHRYQNGESIIKDLMVFPPPPQGSKSQEPKPQESTPKDNKPMRLIK